MTTLHGIKTCDSVRKARRWLEQHDIAYTFRDFRESAPTREEVRDWLTRCDWEQLLNRRSTSWKQLDASARSAVIDAESAIEVIVGNPTVIKRPLLVLDQTVHLGFSDQRYQAIFDSH